MNYAKTTNVELLPVTGAKEFAGFGLEAMINGTPVWVGNCRLLSKFNIKYPAELLQITDTMVVCAIGTDYAGYLLLADTLKEDAKKAIDDLRMLHIKNIQIYPVINRVLLLTLRRSSAYRKPMATCCRKGK